MGDYSKVRFVKDHGSHKTGERADVIEIIQHPSKPKRVQFVILTNGKPIPRDVVVWDNSHG